MKYFRKTALFPLLLCACLWLTASLPRNVAAATPSQPANSPRHFPSEVLSEIMSYEMNPNWKIGYIYDMNEASQYGTDSFSKEEVAAARKVVTERLRNEGLETRSYTLNMFDRGDAGLLPVYVIFDDDVKYIDEKSLDRTYFIRNNEIIFEDVNNLPPAPKGVIRMR